MGKDRGSRRLRYIASDRQSRVLRGCGDDKQHSDFYLATTSSARPLIRADYRLDLPSKGGEKLRSDPMEGLV